MDGRLNRRNKAVFSNFPAVVSTGPKLTKTMFVFDYYCVTTIHKDTKTANTIHISDWLFFFNNL